VTVAAVVLAAGSGSRLALDAPKPLAMLRGRPLVSWALDAAVGSGLEPIVLVVGRDGVSVGASAPSGVLVVTSKEWARGIAHSLHAALDALEPIGEVTAACVGLADQPHIGAEAYRRLAAAHDGGAELAVAVYGGQRANPVLLGRSLWDDAHRLDGDVGARALMSTHDVVEVDCTGTGDPRDVDTLDDLRALEEETEE